jgi:hypothetical protein
MRSACGHVVGFPEQQRRGECDVRVACSRSIAGRIDDGYQRFFVAALRIANGAGMS